MNYRQKMVQQQFLNNEEAVIKRLTQVYTQSLKDCTAKAAQFQAQIDELTAVYDTLEDEAEKEVMKSRIRSKIYQKNYQEAMQKQFGDILDDMHKKNYETVAEYLEGCYDEGFMGALYDLQGQGIPLCFPIDQEAVTRAVQLDSKISEGMYQHLGEDVSQLKKHITAQVSRGISTGMAFEAMAQQLRFKMIGTYNNPGGSLAYALRIARTEGHRIQVQSAMDACHKAKEKGADVVKQWDSTLDAKTRTSHQHVDSEVRELDKPFSNGLMFPGDPDGGAAEVINCRCALLQRARWAIDDGFTKMNNFTKQLESFESPEDYAEFKKSFFSKENRQYMNYVSKMEEKYGTKNFAKVLDAMDTREYNHYSKLLEGNPVFNKKVLTNNGNGDIIKLMADINKMITPYEKKVLDGIPKKKGFFDFAAHGMPNAIEYGSRDMVLTAREVARIIKHHPSYNGENIRLLSCSTGSTEDGFAQQLANAMNKEVEAPTDILFAYPDGRLKVGYKGDGEMKTFKPKGRK